MTHKNHRRGEGNVRSWHPGNVLMRRGQEQEVPAELICHLLVLEALSVERETRLASALPAH